MDTDIIYSRYVRRYIYGDKLELSAMVLVWIEVGCDDDSIAELASCESLLRFLTISNAVELNEYLKKQR